MKTETKIYNELIQANGKKCCVKGCYNMASDITLMTEANNPNGEMYISVCKKHKNDTNPYNIKKGTTAITST